MAIINVVDTYAEFRKNGQRVPFSKGNTTSVAITYNDSFTATGDGLPLRGNATATGKANGTVLTKNSPGALWFQNPRAGRRLYMIGAKASATSAGGTFTLGDRIAHVTLAQDEASGSITGMSATSRLDVADAGNALEACQAFVSVQTVLGAGDNVYTIGYTNHAGVGGRVSQQFTLTGSTGLFRFANSAANTMPFIGLQGNDRGIRSIESITKVSGVGTGGTFNLVLFRPIYDFSLTTQYELEKDFLTQHLLVPEILPDSCLSLIGITTSIVMGLYTTLNLVDV